MYLGKDFSLHKEINILTSKSPCFAILKMEYSITILLYDFSFYAPNFEEVEGAYLLWPVRPFVCPSVCP